jgi:hypothetical protein
MCDVEAFRVCSLNASLKLQGDSINKNIFDSSYYLYSSYILMTPS